jgi:signal transduction histidine kinase
MKRTASRSYRNLLRPSPQEVTLLPDALVPLHRLLRWIQWLAPLGMALLVLVYELGPASWIHDRFSNQHHLLAEIIFYGTIGPVLTFFLIDLLGRWLEERETSELQARALAQAHEFARVGHEVTDDALQALFAASVTLSSLESRYPDLPTEIIAQVHETNRALSPIMQKLYAYQARRLPTQPRR